MEEIKIKEVFSKTLLDLQKLLMDNNLDTELIYKMNTVFHNECLKEYLRGYEDSKNVYNS